MTPHEFLTAVMVYCALVGGSVASWGRTLARNVLVGGVPYSGHRFWLSADVELDQALTPAQRQLVAQRLGRELPPPRDVPEAERRQLAERLGLLVIIEGDHDHVQPLGWRAG